MEDEAQPPENDSELSSPEESIDEAAPEEIAPPAAPVAMARQIEIADEAEAPTTPGLLGHLSARLPEDESKRAVLADALRTLTEWQART